MSSKTSPLNVAAATSSSSSTVSPTTSTVVAATTTGTSSVAAANLSSTAIHVVKIKKELPSDEIKEFAENTMNELLGWYGFDGVDRLDLSAKTSRLLQTAANNANNAINQHHHQHHQHHMEKRRSRSSRAATLLQLQQQQNEHIRNITNNNNNNTNNNNSNNNNRKSATRCHFLRENNSGGGSGGGVISGGGNESTTSDHDTRSSREDDSKSPHSTCQTTMEEKIDFQNCCWCRRPVPENAPEFLTTTDGPRYCSESCFTQSRRASFKKAKTCDWCKHVRHAVSYVDFQDGASQLQFCSDKCLNQYKMQIFCKETQAHLDMNPHLREQSLDAAAATDGLITPELWLRNCRSRSASPASTLSVSPGPPLGHPSSIPSLTSPRITPPNCNHNVATSSATHTGAVAIAHKPMISVAPVSKLMSKSPGIMQNRQSPKHNRKKRPLRSCVSGAEMLTGSGKNNHHSAATRDALSGLSVASVANMLGNKSKSLLSANANNNVRTSPGVHMSIAGGNAKSTASSLSQFAGSSVQDLHMSVPPLSPMLEQQHPHPSHSLPTGGSDGVRCSTTIPAAFFATPNNGQPTPQGTSTQLPPTSFPQHPHGHPPPFLPHPAAGGGFFPRFFSGFANMQPPAPQHMVHAPDMNTPPTSGLNYGGFGGGGLWGTPPPVTVMVPYPIIIPLPIPIPVPLPVIDFYKAHLSQEQRDKLKREEEKEREKKSSASQHEQSYKAEYNRNEQTNNKAETEDVHDQPLDFTKSKEFISAQDYQIDNVEQQDIKMSSICSESELNEDYICLETTAEPIITSPSTTPTPTPTTEDSFSPSHIKATHCIVRTEDADTNSFHNADQLAGSGTASGGDNNSNSESTAADSHTTTDDAKQKLPKFKITRLQTKRTLIQTKESPPASSECSRPLRKRKRIIDCDFQKIALKEVEAAREEHDHQELAADLDNTNATAITTTACNSNTKAYNNNNSKK